MEFSIRKNANLFLLASVPLKYRIWFFKSLFSKHGFILIPNKAKNFLVVEYFIAKINNVYTMVLHYIICRDKSSCLSIVFSNII